VKLSRVSIFSVTCLMVSSWVSASERLDANALRKALVGNTELGQYTDEGIKIPYAEYYREDGKIKGMDLYERYSGSYSIRDDGCLYADYDGDEFDGCYYFERRPDGRYEAYGPGGTVTTISIVPNDPKNLERY
jgi:hypothetical protein